VSPRVHIYLVTVTNQALAPFVKGISSAASLSDCQSSQTLNVISFNLSLKYMLPSDFFLSPRICSVISGVPVSSWADSFYLNTPRALTDQGRLWGGGDYFFLYPGSRPMYKREINKRKTEFFLFYLLPCIHHVYMGNSQRKMSKSLRWLRIQA